MLIKNGDTVLFFGDSITDYYRWNWRHLDHSGFGYYMQTTSLINANHPELDVKFYNRGHAGYSTKNLLERIYDECIDLKPDLVVIFIGVNDSIKRYNGDDIYVSPEEFKDNYMAVISAIKENLPETKIIMVEPFSLPNEPRGIREDLNEKITMVREVAREADVEALIPLDGIMNAAFAEKEDETFWATDGVHPTHAGNALITKHIYKAIMGEEAVPCL
ncbi:MAG: SGNH/GDSL hydrolase family protein [Clostridia bacterium]|nr:SGNH/GDSL hydrolase family protein [Clostridia bacterium]